MSERYEVWVRVVRGEIRMGVYRWRWFANLAAVMWGSAWTCLGVRIEAVVVPHEYGYISNRFGPMVVKT